MSCRNLCAAVLAALSLGHAGPSSAAALGEGEVVVAFVPALTGDPQKDFTRVAKPGDVVTFYVIAGSIPETISNYGFGLHISEAAIAVLSEIRTPGNASAYQNSIGNFVIANVTAWDACLNIGPDTVIAEVDLRWQRAGNLTVRLTGIQDLMDPPEYRVCGDAFVPFDTQATPDVSITVTEAVPVRVTTWGGVKELYKVD